MKESSIICPVSGESLAEEKINVLTHGIGFLLSVMGVFFFVYLALSSSNLWMSLSYIIYAITVAFLYGTSTFYHGCKCPIAKKKLRIFDHIGIYLVIAGSYTPIMLQSFDPPISWIIIGIIWGICLLGSALKFFFTGRFVFLSTCLYLLMGWGSIFIYEELYNGLTHEGFLWLVIGGGFYTFGVIFFLLDDLPYNHAIWHLFSLSGTVSHFYLIAYYIALT
jgi:hemolysin III